MRRDALRTYLLLLLAEGKFTTASYGSMFQKATALFTEDASAILTEIAAAAATHGVRRVSDQVFSSIEDAFNNIASEVGRDGLGKAASRLWQSVKAAYDRGAAAKRR